MQFTLATLALAATALASNHHNHFGMHRRHFNVSSSAIESIVTPASTAPLAPITSVFSTVVPIGTGVESAAPVEPTVAPGPGEEVVTETVDSTITYTLGTGPSASVVTTTVQHVSTRTITHTVVVTRPTAAATDAVEEAAEPTTTIRQTSTFTKVITVFPAPASTGAPAAGGNAANPTGVACEAASTVYLTEKETIYVTVARSSAVAAAPTVVAPIVEESAPAHVEQPVHSSQAGYYPTGVPGQSGVASSSGFLTSYQAQPTGYVRRSFAHRA